MLPARSVQNVPCLTVVILSTSLAGMAVFLRNISFHGILLDALFELGNPDWRTVHSLVSSGIVDGTVKPLQTTVFERDDVEDAFRFMAHGNHVGKVLIKVNCLHWMSPFMPTVAVWAICHML